MLDALESIATIITPVLVLLLTAAGWKYRQSIERRIKLEEKLRDDRVEIYNRILEPFIVLFISDAAWQSDRKLKGRDKGSYFTSIILSLDYRKTSLKLILLGSDAVVKSFNDLMQFFYSFDDAVDSLPEDQTEKAILLLGDFLLEIRRSMGNESTEIDNWGMLEWFLKDVRKLRAASDHSQ